MFGLEILAKLIRILRSAASPSQIAGGFILGMILGLTPFWNLHNALVIILIIVLNVNIAIALASFAIFSGVAYIFDPLFHDLGFFLLADSSALRSIWIALYNMPLIGASNFNNTVVMGSLIVSLLLLLPAYYSSRYSVIWYRENIDAKMQKWKIVQMVKGSKIYGFYSKIRNMGD